MRGFVHDVGDGFPPVDAGAKDIEEETLDRTDGLLARGTGEEGVCLVRQHHRGEVGNL